MKHRRAPLTLLAFLLALPLLFAQRYLPEEKKPDEPIGFDLPTDDKLATHLEVARERIAKKDWPVAATLLQKVLDRPGEVFVPIVRAGADGKETKAIVNARAEAARLIGSMPEEGLAHYRKEYGHAAADFYKQARTFDDPGMYAEVMQRYFYTDSGIDAAERLAVYLLDRGNHSSAALCFERLLGRTGAEKLSPLTLFRAALAFERAGGERRREMERVLKALETKVGKEGLKIGDRMHSFAELRKEIEKQKPAQRALTGWPMFRGDANRNAAAPGGIPFLEPLWKFDNVNDGTTRTRLKQATDYLDTVKRPQLFSSHPIGLVLRRGKENETALVVWRDFWGVRTRTLKAVPKDELKAGDIYWEAPSTWSMERMIREPKYVGLLSQWLQNYMDGRMRPQVLLENSLTGTVSTDGPRVYVVEDFQVPPISLIDRVRFPVGGPGGMLGDALIHNRLQAYDADAGKLIWEIGEAGGKGDLSDSFFLGAPLPLNGKLYVLNEKAQELRLMTLDPATGNLLERSVTFGKFRGNDPFRPLRRAAAAHLAYADGILVCPTHVGSVLGVDLLTHQIVWAFGYEEPAAKPVGRVLPFGRVPPPGMVLLPDGRWISAVPQEDTWRDSPPLIAGKHVLVSPPDGNSLYCLNLNNGQLLWKMPRASDDLYVGGVIGGRVLIVGHKTCRALALADGKEVWRLDTGTPSGLGVSVGGHYYLPLARGAKSAEPELAVLDAGKGIVVSRVRSRKKEILGNLMFFEGMLISQTVSSIAAYPMLEIELAALEKLLAKKPKDPEGLARRGILKLDRGDLKSAIEDFHAALQNKPDDALRGQVRGKLSEALNELLQRDFTAAEPHLKEIEELTREKGLSPEEAKQRRVRFLMLAGIGRETQGKRVEAVRYYIELAGVGGGELIALTEDPALKVSPAVWVRGRLDALIKKASAEEKKQIDKELMEWLKKARSEKSSTSFRSLAAAFSTASSVGREARLGLAERLAQENEFLAGEQLLLEVRGQKHDRAAAARAIDRLAALSIRMGLLADALYFFKELARDHGNVAVRPGKTGKDLYDEVLTDKRLLPFLGETGAASRIGLTPSKATEVTGNFAEMRPQELRRGGERHPSFEQYRLGFRTVYSQLIVNDRRTGEELSSYTLNAGTAGHRIADASHARCQNVGHVVLMTLAHRVFAFSPLSSRMLWEADLLEEGGKEVAYRSHVYNSSDGSLKITYDGWTQRLPRSGLLAPGIAILHTRTGLRGVSLADGRTLWQRSGMASDLDLFHDGEHLFVTELDAKGHAQATRVLEMQSGLPVKGSDFPALHEIRLKPYGHTVVLAELQTDKLVLRQYDVLAGKNLWTRPFPAGSLVLDTEEEDLVGAVQPDGKVAVIGLDGGKEVFSGELKPEHLKGAEGVFLLRDASAYYLACRQRKPDTIQSAEAYVRAGSGLRAVPANGAVYCFESKGGLRWVNMLEAQSLLISRFQAMPALVFSVRQMVFLDRQKMERQARFLTRVIDKKTGKILFDREETTGVVRTPIHTLNTDESAGAAEVIHDTGKLRIAPRSP